MNISRRFSFESATKARGWLIILAVLAFFLTMLMSPPSRAEDRDIDFSQAELDQLLSPIALYPDSLLSQVLMAATYPIEVVQANRWASTHADIKGEDAVRAVDSKDWDPSVKALVAFPDLLDRMSDDLDWTQKLGDAFLSDQRSVMDAVQRLRRKADASGSLRQVQHLRINHDDDDIIIEPAEERVIYVPTYDTRVVYGSWWWPDYQPIFWHYPSSYVFVGGFYWGPRAYIGPTYFYSGCSWRERSIRVIDYRGHYDSSPHFYTSRSIITFQSSRDWHHDPVHRRGVAYYNDNLSVTYGSHHPSYRNDHDYREHRFDNDYLTRHPEINRSHNNGVQFNQNVDRRMIDNHNRDNDRNDDHWDRNEHHENNWSNDNNDRDNHRDHDNNRRDDNNRNDDNHNRWNDGDKNTHNNWQPGNQTQNNNGNRPAWESNGQHERMRAGSDQTTAPVVPNISRESLGNSGRDQIHQMQREQNQRDDSQQTKPEAVHVDNQNNRRVENKNDRRTPPKHGREKDDN